MKIKLSQGGNVFNTMKKSSVAVTLAISLALLSNTKAAEELKPDVWLMNWITTVSKGDVTPALDEEYEKQVYHIKANYPTSHHVSKIAEVKKQHKQMLAKKIGVVEDMTLVDFCYEPTAGLKVVIDETRKTEQHTSVFLTLTYNNGLAAPIIEHDAGSGRKAKARLHKVMCRVDMTKEDNTWYWGLPDVLEFSVYGLPELTEAGAKAAFVEYIKGNYTVNIETQKGFGSKKDPTTKSGVVEALNQLGVKWKETVRYTRPYFSLDSFPADWNKYKNGSNYVTSHTHKWKVPMWSDATEITYKDFKHEPTKKRYVLIAEVDLKLNNAMGGQQSIYNYIIAMNKLGLSKPPNKSDTAVNFEKYSVFKKITFKMVMLYNILENKWVVAGGSIRNS